MVYPSIMKHGSVMTGGKFGDNLEIPGLVNVYITMENPSTL
jgi:hypothetical protein